MVVTIRVKRDTYTVGAVFRLFNTGDTTVERVGFPKFGEWNVISRLHSPVVHDFSRFNAWVDGHRADFIEERDFLTDPSTPVQEPQRYYRFVETRWMVGEVTLPGHSVTTIRIKYEGLYNPSRTDLDMGGWAVYYYGTARYWKGKIGKAILIEDTTDAPGKGEWIGRKGPQRRTVLGAGPRIIPDKLLIFEKGEFDPPIDAKLSFGPGPGPLRYPASSQVIESNLK